MSGKVKLKEVFEVESKLEPFYSGGDIEWSDDGLHLFCLFDGVVNILLVDSRKVIRSIGIDPLEPSEDAVISFCLGAGEFMHLLITSHKSGLLRAWNWLDGSLERKWKHFHNGLVLKLRLRPYIYKSSFEISLVTGGPDRCLKLWDIKHGQCTQVLRDKDYQGATSIVEWAESEDNCEIWASANDYKIHIWDITNGEKVTTLEGHYSTVIGIIFHWDGCHAVTVGRDKIFILWDRINKLSLRNFAIPDSPEGFIILPKLDSNELNLNENGIYIMLATDKGYLRLMDAQRGCELKSHQVDNSSLTGLLSCKTRGQLAYITSDQIIGIQHFLDQEPSKLLVGFNDEIIDIALIGEDESFLTVASNSSDIKVFQLNDMSCFLLRGHKDYVLSLSASPFNKNLLASSSKDRSLRLWIIAPEGNLQKSHCIAHLERHTSSVGSICLGTFLMASASQDGCLKIWSLPKNNNIKTDLEIELKGSKLAHSKEINAIVISSDEKIICTCSADKSAKLWDSSNLELIGILQGHRRGVWHASFHEQLIATASSDTTIRIWQLSNLECLKTIEVSDSATLRCCWINSGRQLISASGDGIIRIWCLDSSSKKQNVWGGEKTPIALSEHESRIWTFSVSSNENRIISGDANSRIIIWRDATETHLEENAKKTAQLVLEEQHLANLKQLGHTAEALILAIKLNRPKDALFSIKELINTSSTSKNNLSFAIEKMDLESKEHLLKFACEWNTRSQNSLIAAEVLSNLLPELSSNKFSKSTTQSSVEALLAYTKRHYERLSTIHQDLYLLEYSANIMQSNLLN